MEVSSLVMNLEEDEGARLEVRLRYLVQTHPRLLVALVPLLCKPRLLLAILTKRESKTVIRNGSRFSQRLVKSWGNSPLSMR